MTTAFSLSKVNHFKADTTHGVGWIIYLNIRVHLCAILTLTTAGMNSNNCSLDGDTVCETADSSAVMDTALSGFKKPRPVDPISTETKVLLEIYINCVTFMVISLLGIVANVINVTVYWKQGFNDGITFGFFALSSSDLVLVLMTFCTSIWYILRLMIPNSDVDFQSIHYVSSATLRNMCYSMSSDLTAFLSVERCFCVVMPFKVKVIFSRKRSTAIIMAIVCFHCLCFLPLFVTHQLRWLPTGRPVAVNGTLTMRRMLRVYFLSHRKDIEKVNTMISGIITPTLSQAIVTVCIVILIGGLKESSRFRRSIAANSSSTVTGNASEPKNQSEKPTVDGVVNKSSENQNQMTSRDIRLVKTMIFLVIIFSISNVPLLAITYTKHIVPEFNFRRAYHNTATFAYSIIYLLSSINATTNVLVYYNTSSRFRGMTRSLFSCQNAPSSTTRKIK